MADYLRKSMHENEFVINNDKDRKEYTKMFFQKPLSFKQAGAWVFIHYMTIGIIQGYYQAVGYSLQANGASDNDQSTYSLALYPFSFKFIFSPFLDRFYINRFGRSKTYVVNGGLIMGFIFCFLGGYVESMVRDVKVVPLTILMTAVLTITCVVQIAGEAWILTMFNKEDKAKASTLLGVGQILGVMLGYNIFTPLNDIDWLNDNIFTKNPIASPILSHTLFCFIVAGLYFSQIIFNILFIAEERITDGKAKDICKILAVVPRHFTNSHMRALVFYMFGCRFIYFLIDFTLDLRLIRNGYLNMGRSTISNIDTMVFPVVFVLSTLTIYYMKQGILVRMFHLNTFVVVLLGAFRFITYLDLIHNQNYTRVYICRLVSGIISGMDFSQFFMMAFFNLVVNKAVGNTGITCLIALLNQTMVLSRTVGLKASHYIEYEKFVPICLVIQTILLIGLFKYALHLDNKNTKLYDTANLDST